MTLGRLLATIAVVLAVPLAWPMFGIWGLFGVVPVLSILIAVFVFGPLQKSERDDKHRNVHDSLP